MKIILDSSMLEWVEFYQNENILVVKFQDKTLKSGKLRIGGTYKYLNVTEDIYNTLINAKTNSRFENSHGKCFHALILSFPDKFTAIPI